MKGFITFLEKLIFAYTIFLVFILLIWREMEPGDLELLLTAFAILAGFLTLYSLIDLYSDQRRR